ncbi:MAG TPA: selenocysteine-specific translation elongation factor [Patescibacteria group bacterium]|nr:selenocysteine-specific translation elongation factor [Patescibacteria group bacterium]
MKNVLVGTAGHIDHGKSSLVEALTGTHPDRLEEEKRRGITIDLGFAFLKTEAIHLAFVDVPGHERFVRNMLAGAGGIDLVLMVVAADESIKPQTREHFDICRLLGIQRGLVALTKADLVDRDTSDLVRLEIEEFVRGSFLEGVPIQPVSTRTGAGIDELKSLLLRAAAGVPERPSSGYSRLPIDRAFAMKGFGTVVTGTLVSGMVKTGDELELLPGGRRVRVRGIQSAGEMVEQAVAGQRTALNLAGMELEAAGRGMALASPGRFAPTRQLDARIQMLGSAKPLKNRTLVHFHQGTAQTVGEVVLIERDAIEPGGTGYARLRLREPLLLLPGDRFILRQFSPVTTIGGGIVLDNSAQRHRRRDGSILPLLQTLESGSREAILESLVKTAPGGLSREAAVARTAWVENDVESLAEKLEGAGTVKIVSREPWVMAPAESVGACAERIVSMLEEFHRANPLAAAMPKQELRERAGRNQRPEIFRAALDGLILEGRVALAADRVMRAGRKIVFTAEEERARGEIERAFEQAGLAAPRLAEILPRLPVDPKRAEKLLQILVGERVLLKISDDLLVHARSAAKLRAMLADYKQRKGDRLSVAAFKEMAGISRKYAIPLLEYLDRERVTRRVGEERVIL